MSLDNTSPSEFRTVEEAYQALKIEIKQLLIAPCTPQSLRDALLAGLEKAGIKEEEVLSW